MKVQKTEEYHLSTDLNLDSATVREWLMSVAPCYKLVSHPSWHSTIDMAPMINIIMFINRLEGCEL